MENSRSFPKNQHYVPRFLLRNFVFNEDEQIYVFDKKTEKVYYTNIKNIASEQKFYDIKSEEYVFSLEPSLSELESRASEIVRYILHTQDIKKISDDEKKLLSTFIAVQFHRVKQARESLLDVSKLLEERLIEWGLDPEKVGNFRPLDEEGAKQISLAMVTEYEQTVPYIYDKWWFLYKTPKTRPFYISDNPVVMQNMYDYRPLGNLGLAVKGIEVYMPLSKTITLALYCRSHEELVRDNYQKIQLIEKYDKSLNLKKKHKRPYDSIRRLWNGLQSGQAVPTEEANQINLNSLQVAYSSRFIFSYSNDFKLAHQMVKENPKLKFGAPKPSS